MLKRKPFWGVVLIVISVIILISSGLGIYNLIRGPKSYEELGGVDSGGRYVQAEISIIFDIFMEETSERGEVTGAYAIIPYGDEYYMLLYIPAEYMDSAQQIFEDTTSYLDGELDKLGSYCVVRGTIRAINNDDLSEAYLDRMEGLEDYALGYVLEVGTVGYLPTGWVIALTAISTVCLVSGVVLVVFDLRKKKEAA